MTTATPSTTPNKERNWYFTFEIPRYSRFDQWKLVAEFVQAKYENTKNFRCHSRSLKYTERSRCTCRCGLLKLSCSNWLVTVKFFFNDWVAMKQKILKHNVKCGINSLSQYQNRERQQAGSIPRFQITIVSIWAYKQINFRHNFDKISI